MRTRENKAWNLEDFLDSLILELDKAQDTLSLKGLTRKLTYTVKDVALDLNIFPVMEDGKVNFHMAKPGEEGGSKISFQLGSITDRQIRENANELPKKGDITLDALDEVDDEVRDSLRKVGVTSTRDLEKLDNSNVNLDNVVKEKTGGRKKLDYANLANQINKARRRKLSPQLSLFQAKNEEDDVEMCIQGQNLVLQKNSGYPAATLNNKRVEIITAGAEELWVKAPKQFLKSGDNTLAVALDPYAVMNVKLQN